MSGTTPRPRRTRTDVAQRETASTGRTLRVRTRLFLRRPDQVLLPKVTRSRTGPSTGKGFYTKLSKTRTKNETRQKKKKNLNSRGNTRCGTITSFSISPPTKNFTHSERKDDNESGSGKIRLDTRIFEGSS